MCVASSCFDSLVPCSALELCLFHPMDFAVRWMTFWLPMDVLRAVCRARTKTCFPDAPLRSGSRPKPQNWKSDESTEVEETSAEEDQVWNDDSDADWTIDSEGRSSLSGGSVCALVASDGQASLRRSISETDLLVSEEEVNQTFACWSADLETTDLLTTATPPPTLRAAEPRRLRNDFEDFFGTRRPQLIRSAEIALPLLTSWDLLVVDKPAGTHHTS